MLGKRAFVLLRDEIPQKTVKIILRFTGGQVTWRKRYIDKNIQIASRVSPSGSSMAHSFISNFDFIINQGSFLYTPCCPQSLLGLAVIQYCQMTNSFPRYLHIHSPVLFRIICAKLLNKSAFLTWGRGHFSLSFAKPNLSS